MALFTKKRWWWGGGWTANTFDNWLTEDSGLVKRGWTLNGTTQVNMEDNDLEMRAGYNFWNVVRDYRSRFTSFFQILWVERTYGTDKKVAFEYVGDASDIGEWDYGAGIGVIDNDQWYETTTRYRLDDGISEMSMKQIVSDWTGRFERYQNSSNSVERVSDNATWGIIETAVDASTPYRQKTVEDGTGDRNSLKVIVDWVEIEKLPNTRDDTWTVDQENQIYTDSNGMLRSAPLSKVPKAWLLRSSSWTAGAGNRYFSPNIHVGPTTGNGVLSPNNAIYLRPFVAKPNMTVLWMITAAYDSWALSSIRYGIYKGEIWDVVNPWTITLVQDFWSIWPLTTTRLIYNIMSPTGSLALNWWEKYWVAVTSSSWNGRTRWYANANAINPYLWYTVSGTAMAQCSWVRTATTAWASTALPATISATQITNNSSASNVVAPPLLSIL